jgi:hypothetical protein
MLGEEFHPDDHKDDQPQSGPDLNELRVKAAEVGFGPQGRESTEEIGSGHDEETARGAGDTVLGAVGVEDPAEQEEGMDAETQQKREETWEHDPERAHSMASSIEDDVSKYGSKKREAQRLRESAQQKHEEAQTIREKGVLDRVDTAKVSSLEAKAKEDESDARRLERFAPDELSDAPRKMEKAGSVYDAKQSLPHELESLSRQDEQEAKDIVSKEKKNSYNLRELRQEYQKARDIEERMKKVVQEAYGVTEKFTDFAGEHGYSDSDIRALSETVYGKVKELDGAIDDALKALLTQTRELADEVLRAQEAQEKETKEATEHFEEHESEYYDTALREMTDKGVKFETNNPPASE